MPEQTASPDPIPALEETLADATADRLVTRADALIGQLSLAAAAHYLDRALVRWPSDPRIVLRLAETVLRWRDYDRFDELTGPALVRFPRQADLLALAARSYADRDQPCRAIRAYGRAARLDGDDVESVQRVATLFRRAGRPFLSRRFLRRHLARHPEVAALHAALGFAYVDDERYPKAVACFEAAVAREPEESRFLDDWAGALLLAERWRDAAVVAVRSLKARASNERAWTVFAIAQRHLGDLEKAEKGYRKAVEHAKDEARARGNLGLFLAKRSTAPDARAEARSHLNAALLEHPDWTEVESAYEELRRG